MKKNFIIHQPNFARVLIILLCIILGFGGLIWRIYDLTVKNRSFLLKQSNMRILRKRSRYPLRGSLLDRNGQILAISMAAHTAWVEPFEYLCYHHSSQQLANALNQSSWLLHHRIVLAKKRNRHYFIVAKNLKTSIRKNLEKKGIKGLYFSQHHQRYYPKGAIFAPVLGFTNTQDHGQEGLELALDPWLQGKSGRFAILKNATNQIVAKSVIKRMQTGQDIHLTMDAGIQFIAYQALNQAVVDFQASNGSAIVLDIESGDILAMANFPSFDPNAKKQQHEQSYKNIAITDLFEPGSTIKALSAINIIHQSHQLNPKVDVGNGHIRIQGHHIEDEVSDLGHIHLDRVIQKSSNVGMSLLTLQYSQKGLYDVFRRMGLGQSPGTGFPGEAHGRIIRYRDEARFSRATQSFGYSMSVSLMQLAQAFAIIARDGIHITPHFIDGQYDAHRQFDIQTMRMIKKALHLAVNGDGTGFKARIASHDVAGKTGTANIASVHGYDPYATIASFIGFSPVDHPKYLVAVVIQKPDIHHRFGGLSAAPVFSQIMDGIWRTQNKS